MKNIYDYGSSVISTDLKYNFNSNNMKYTMIRDSFWMEVKVYCGRKIMYASNKDFFNININKAIEIMFRKKIEKDCIFHKGKNYYATFKVYNEVPVTRYKYIKTDTLITTTRRKYLLQERINFHI